MEDVDVKNERWFIRRSVLAPLTSPNRPFCHHASINNVFFIVFALFRFGLFTLFCPRLFTLSLDPFIVSHPWQDPSALRQNVPEALYAIMVAHQASALVLKSSQARILSVFLGDVLSLSGNTDQYVIPGNIIVRQRGTQFHPGQHVRLSSARLAVNLNAHLSR